MSIASTNSSASSTADPAIASLDIRRTELIAAPIALVFETILDEIGPHHEPDPGNPLPMKLEAWPGGRWYRDLGNNSGHLWGHVQVIKPPTLLELSGPLFMSYPAISHVQYRLAAEGNGTRLTLRHRALGMIEKEHREGVEGGWTTIIQKIRDVAQRRNSMK